MRNERQPCLEKEESEKDIYKRKKEKRKNEEEVDHRSTTPSGASDGELSLAATVTSLVSNKVGWFSQEDANPF